jgi:hypothetical protein
MASAAAPAAAAEDDGWDPAWDAPEGGPPGAAGEAQPATWDAFFAQSAARSERAMRDAGMDPRKCVRARRRCVSRLPARRRRETSRPCEEAFHSRRNGQLAAPRVRRRC